MKIQVWKDKKGSWWWRIVARNGVSLTESRIGYERRGHAVRMAQQVSTGVELEVVDVDA